MNWLQITGIIFMIPFILLILSAHCYSIWYFYKNRQDYLQCIKRIWKGPITFNMLFMGALATIMLFGILGIKLLEAGSKVRDTPSTIAPIVSTE